MKYVYYQSVPDGKITAFHRLVSEWSDKEIKRRVSEYNREHNQTCNAVIVDVEEGGFMDFLIGKATERIQINQEILRDLKDYIDNAAGIIESLIYGGNYE